MDLEDLARGPGLEQHPQCQDRRVAPFDETHGEQQPATLGVGEHVGGRILVDRHRLLDHHCQAGRECLVRQLGQAAGRRREAGEVCIDRVERVSERLERRDVRRRRGTTLRGGIGDRDQLRLRVGAQDPQVVGPDPAEADQDAAGAHAATFLKSARRARAVRSFRISSANRFAYQFRTWRR